MSTVHCCGCVFGCIARETACDLRIGGGGATGFFRACEGGAFFGWTMPCLCGRAGSDCCCPRIAGFLIGEFMARASLKIEMNDSGSALFVRLMVRGL